MSTSELSIMPTSERGYHAYHLEAIAIDRGILFAEELLALAAYVEANRAQLEAQAQVNAAKEQRAWDEDMRDMERIKREWRDYRTAEDETPPTMTVTVPFTAILEENGICTCCHEEYAGCDCYMLRCPACNACQGHECEHQNEMRALGWWLQVMFDLPMHFDYWRKKHDGSQTKVIDGFFWTRPGWRERYPGYRGNAQRSVMQQKSEG